MAIRDKRVLAKPSRLRKNISSKSEGVGKLIPALFGIGLLIFLIFGMVFYYQVYLKPENVFWGMINNNLSTRGITRQVEQKGGEQTSNEYAQFNFGLPTAVKLTRTLTSNTDNQNYTKLEGLGFSDTDYQRYLEVGRSNDTTQQGFDKLIGKWVKTGSSGENSAEPPNILLRALLGPVLSANLQPNERQSAIIDMQSKNVYKVDFNNVEKTNENGRSVYKFKASVNLRAFTQVMSKYLATMGVAGAETLDPEAYAEDETIDVKLWIDPRSRQLVKIEYADSEINETYGGYGAVSNIEAPSEYLTTEEFQSLIGQ